jgi:hypothetical protein
VVRIDIKSLPSFNIGAVAEATMNLDEDRIDDAVLALLYLGLHEGDRAWKGFDWDALDRLHAKGLISDPRRRAKSVVFSEEGLKTAQERLLALFGRES